MAVTSPPKTLIVGVVFPAVIGAGLLGLGLHILSDTTNSISLLQILFGSYLVLHFALSLLATFRSTRYSLSGFLIDFLDACAAFVSLYALGLLEPGHHEIRYELLFFALAISPLTHLAWNYIVYRYTRWELRALNLVRLATALAGLFATRHFSAYPYFALGVFFLCTAIYCRIKGWELGFGWAG